MNRVFVPPWKGLLQRKTDEHFRAFTPMPGTHASRILEFGCSCGRFGGHIGVALPPLAMADDKTAEPKPIPGGATVFGIPDASQSVAGCTDTSDADR